MLPKTKLKLRMRSILLLMVIVVLAPALAALVAHHLISYKMAWTRGVQANLEVGRSEAAAFRVYVDKIERQAHVIGLTLARIGQDADWESSYLVQMAELYPDVDEYYWVSPSGIVIASSLPQSVGVSVADHEYFQRILDGEDVVLGNLLKERSRGGLLFPVVCAVRDGQGSLQGVVLAGVTVPRVAEFLMQLHRHDDARVVLIDREGTLVAMHPPICAAGEMWIEKNSLLATALDGRETYGSFLSPVDGTQRLGVYVPVQDYGYVLGTSVPLAAVFRPLNRMLIFALSWTLLLAALSLGLALLLSRRNLRAVQTLQRQAMALAQGQLGCRSEASSGIVELDSLAVDLNSMAARLQAAQAQLRESEEHLQKTAALAEERATQAEEARRSLDLLAHNLRRSNGDLEQFAYVASHDLQEPLRVANGFIQLMQEKIADQSDEETKEYMGCTISSLKRMQTLVGDLLKYSRLASGEADVSNVDMEDLLLEVVDDLELVIGESGAEVTHDPLPTVMGDRTQFKQVLTNLIGNALKFRKDNEPPSVHVAAGREQDGWRFAVSDNGIGIEPGSFDRIFMIFQRLHTRSEYTGTGIGLAICRRIIERHGGRIQVESEVGRGAVFSFTVPDNATCA